MKEKTNEAPDFSGIELPAGWMQTTQDPVAFRATINKAHVLKALTVHFRKGLNSQAELVKAMNEILIDDQRLDEAQWDYIGLCRDTCNFRT